MKNHLIRRFEAFLSALINPILKIGQRPPPAPRYRVPDEAVPIDQLILTEQAPERRRVNEGFMVMASVNGGRSVGYVAGRIAPFSSTCFVEALYIDDRAYLGKGLSVRLLERAVAITACQNIVPVSIEERAASYWEHLRNRPGLGVREGINSKGMRERLEKEFILDWKQRNAEFDQTTLLAAEKTESIQK